MPRELDLPRSESDLNELFLSSAAYRNSAEFVKMMGFVARRSRIAPFNAYLLYIQKPDILRAASRAEWSAEGRFVKEGARPLIILKPFAPVEFVYDMEDTQGSGVADGTEGANGAKGANSAKGADNGEAEDWRSKGFVPESEIAGIVANMEAAGLCLDPLDLKELRLRYRVPVPFSQARREPSRRLQGLRPGTGRKDLPAFFGALANEYARHLLGHWGAFSVEINGKLHAVCDRDRSDLDRNEMEWEAECVAFIVCGRVGLGMGGAEVLARHLDPAISKPRIDFFAVLAAANKMLKGFSLPKGPELPSDGLQLLLF